MESQQPVMADASDVNLPGRTAAKRRAIRAAARDLFLLNGYAGTSMDEIAAKAQVSKQTVYKQFADKAQLFEEIVVGDISAAEARNRALLDELPDAQDFETSLRDYARRHIVDVLQPHVIQMRRTVIGAATQFPGLARTWWENGPQRGHSILAERFERAAKRGVLRFDDPLLAAQHFNWLILSIPLNEAMFLDDEETFTNSELEDLADAGVRVFLAAYGAGQPSDHA